MSLKAYLHRKFPKFYSFIRRIKWDNSLIRYISVFCRYLTNRPLAARNDLPFLLNLLNLHGRGVEVGTWRGYFSKHILIRSKLAILFSVDPWCHFSEDIYYDIANVSQAQFDEIFFSVKKLLAKFGKRSQILRMSSYDASRIFQESSLDFIYIDANHSYDECKKDLELWYPKLKKGGIFAGHDYLDGKLPGGDFGVKSAVNDFLKLHPHGLFVTPERFPTWYFIK